MSDKSYPSLWNKTKFNCLLHKIFGVVFLVTIFFGVLLATVNISPVKVVADAPTTCVDFTCDDFVPGSSTPNTGTGRDPDETRPSGTSGSGTAGTGTSRPPGGTGATTSSSGSGRGSSECSGLDCFQIINVKCLFPDQEGCKGQPNIYDIVINFLLGIAPYLAVLVIMWGGYQIFFGAFDGGKADGLKTVQAGVTGLIIVLLADQIASRDGLIYQMFNGTGNNLLNAEVLKGVLEKIIGFLFNVSTVAAVLVVVWGGYQVMFSAIPGNKEDGLETVKKGVLGLVIILVARTIVNVVQGVVSPSLLKGDFGFNAQTIINFVQIILAGIVIPISSILTVFFVVIGAYYYIMSRGDSEMVKKGENAIKNALIGLIVVLLATTIVQFVRNFIVNNSSLYQTSTSSPASTAPRPSGSGGTGATTTTTPSTPSGTTTPRPSTPRP